MSWEKRFIKGYNPGSGQCLGEWPWSIENFQLPSHSRNLAGSGFLAASSSAHILSILVQSRSLTWSRPERRIWKDSLLLESGIGQNDWRDTSSVPGQVLRPGAAVAPHRELACSLCKATTRGCVCISRLLRSPKPRCPGGLRIEATSGHQRLQGTMSVFRNGGGEEAYTVWGTENGVWTPTSPGARTWNVMV